MFENVIILVFYEKIYLYFALLLNAAKKDLKKDSNYKICYNNYFKNRYHLL